MSLIVIHQKWEGQSRRIWLGKARGGILLTALDEPAVEWIAPLALLTYAEASLIDFRIGDIEEFTASFVLYLQKLLGAANN